MFENWVNTVLAAFLPLKTNLKPFKTCRFQRD